MAEIVNQGNLLPDALILRVLRQQFMTAHSEGTDSFLLDGFPRTPQQAEALEQIADVQLALNMSLREEVRARGGQRTCAVAMRGAATGAPPPPCQRPLPSPPPPRPCEQLLVEKCLGRRMCKKCGKNYNVADIYLPASEGRPEIIMPPLNPPPECQQHMEQRSDDTEPVVRRRLEVYKQQAQPVEDFYRARGKLVDFAITGSIPVVFPQLQAVLQPYLKQVERAHAA